MPEVQENLWQQLPSASEGVTPSNPQNPWEACHEAQDYQLTRACFFSLSTSFNLSNSYIFLASTQDVFHTAFLSEEHRKKHSSHSYNLH